MKPRTGATYESTASTLRMRPKCSGEILLAVPDTREDYGENRWIGIGTIRGRVAVAAFAEAEADILRIISLRKATRSEIDQYERAIQDELEEG